MSLDVLLEIDSGAGRRGVRLADYLDAHGEESAADDAYAWIKALRHARVGGDTLRGRFMYRGDSLWWFAELYLHKERVVVTLFRTLRAMEALIERERPLAIGFTRIDRIVGAAVAAAAATRQIRCSSMPARRSAMSLAAIDARSTALAFAAMASPRRPLKRQHEVRAIVAAFVHSAFWRPDASDDGSAEAYIGPVLQALDRQVTEGSVQYVGVGPSMNFRARRWWNLSRRSGPARGTRRVVPVEQLVPRSALRGSWELWRSRHAVRRELRASDDIRQAAVIRGCDCWTVIREAIDGIALLQFPWSARAMDEAGAALDALKPAVAVTYAEAGGWGRALALEARRRGIPLAGLQHGFIYRHWLNYRHEPDEITSAFEGSPDAGFPRPTLTLVFDEYAAQHLTGAARFPCEAVAVTGSPRLDALAAELKRLSPDAIGAARREAGADAGEPIVLVVSKYSEIRSHLAPLLDAIRDLPGVRAVIKTHPAETPAPYDAAARDTPAVRVLPPATPLGPLLRAARVIVTVNSTVAIDGLALGIPALTIGLPNNLTPFVDLGAIAGAAAPEEVGPALRRVLYDEGFRQQLEAAAATVVRRYRIVADGQAAERTASAILGLAAPGVPTGEE